MRKLNHFLLGLSMGLLAPAIVVTAVLLSGEFNGTFGEILRYTHGVGYLSVLLRPALLANLALFVLFFNVNYMKTCRGIIIGTLGYGLYMLINWLMTLI